MTSALTFGDPDEVKRALQRYAGSDSSGQSLGAAMARLIDRPEDARSELRKRLDDPGSSSDILGLGIMAQWAAYFDAPQLALEALRKSQRQPDLYSLWSIWRPLFKDTRQLPGFKQFLREARIVDYWRESGNWGDFCRPVGAGDFECK